MPAERFPEGRGSTPTQGRGSTPTRCAPPVVTWLSALEPSACSRWSSWPPGKDPIRAYVDTFHYTLANAYGFSELVVRMIPLLLTAVAVALPPGSE